MQDIVLDMPEIGVTMAGIAFGPHDGLPMLGLHGWLDNAATWQPLGPEFARYVVASSRN
jgi:hypothetical protein